MNSPEPERCLAALYDLLDFHAQLKEPDADKVWPRVLETLAAALDADAATYYSYLPAKNHLLPRYALGGAAGAVTSTAIDVATGICGWTARHREPALVADAYHDERFFKDVDTVSHIKTRTVMTVPLLDRSELTGVLQFINKRSGPFTPEDLRFVVAACRATAAALRGLRLESSAPASRPSSAETPR